MIERYQFLLREFYEETSKELQIFSIIAQSFFQPFSLVDNLLVILTALTAGPGVGFNRAMLFRRPGRQAQGRKLARARLGRRGGLDLEGALHSRNRLSRDHRPQQVTC